MTVVVPGDGNSERRRVGNRLSFHYKPFCTISVHPSVVYLTIQKLFNLWKINKAYPVSFIYLFLNLIFFFLAALRYVGS